MRFSHHLPWISTERGVVQGVESVVVGQRDVGRVIQQNRQHVVPLLGNSVVQRSVAFGILKKKRFFRRWLTVV